VILAILKMRLWGLLPGEEAHPPKAHPVAAAVAAVLFAKAI
jgi:hypothetical protein